MHIPLVIAILAFLAFLLLPILDWAVSSERDARELRPFLVRIARWTQE